MSESSQNNTKNGKLLPCPFCGGEAEVLTAESYLFGIMCNDCRSRGDVYDTEAEAIAAWNTRVEWTCHLFRRAAYGTVDGVELALYECSECGEPIEPKDGWNYCPNCGAKVRSE